MKKLVKKYEKPIAVELSNFTANGGDISPQGVCRSGSIPYYSCEAGPGFVGSCEGGGAPDTSSCFGGGYHTMPSCNHGSSAATICVSGAVQQ